MKKRLKQIFFGIYETDLCLIWSINILLLSGVFAFWRYDLTVYRLWLAVLDLCHSLKYYASKIFGSFLKRLTGEELPSPDVPLDELPEIDLKAMIGFDLPELVDKIENFWIEFIDPYNFIMFLAKVLDDAYQISFYVVLFLPLLVLLFFFGKDLLCEDKDKPIGHISKPYAWFLGVSYRVLLPAYRRLTRFVKYFFKHKKIFYTFLVLWLVNLNLAAIAVEVIAFYFYFVASFDVLSFPMQILRLFVDVLIMLNSAPWLFWALAALVIYVLWAVAKGFDELEHMEAKNCGFIKLIELVCLVIGPPGFGKTQLITDMAVSTVNIHKKDALDIMLEAEMLFPGFPFVQYRDDILMRVVTGEIYTVFVVDYHVERIKASFEVGEHNLYDYDTRVYALEKNVGNRIVSLWDTLIDYGRAYVVYLQENPSIANYPIRFDGHFDDSCYFPRWKGNLFRGSARSLEEKSRYSHILDQDILRMGKTVKVNNPLCGTFGYGIYSNTEWGKCRGNQVTNADKDAKAVEANAKNDLYSYSLKLARHNGCTIAGKAFFRFFGDEQRPQSLAQDQRDLCSIITIVDKSDMRLALPGFGFIDWIYEKIYEPFLDFYFDFSNKRGDSILTVQLMKNALGAFSHVYRFLYGTFGYRVLTLRMESGTVYGEGGDKNGEAVEREYYLMNKKIFSDRYATDCYSGFFKKKQMECGRGIDDIPTYSGRYMTWDNMEQQNDYYLMDMMKIMIGEEDPPEPPNKEKRSERKSGKKESSWSDDFEFTRY